MNVTTDEILNTSVQVYFEGDAQVAELKSKIDEATKEAEEVTVLTVQSVEKAAILINGFSKIEKKAEEIRKVVVGPLNDKVKEVNSFFKSLTLPFKPQADRLEKEMLEYNRKQKRIADEKAAEEKRLAEQKAIDEAIQKENRLKEEAKQRGENPDNVKVEIAIIPEIITPDEKLSTKNSVGVGTMKINKWRIVDETKIPREYFLLDETRINKLCKASGVGSSSTIPGIEYYTEDVIKRG